LISLPNPCRFVALIFPSSAEQDKVIDLFWADPELCEMPRDLVGGFKILVPEEIVDYLRTKSGAQFEVTFKTVIKVRFLSRQDGINGLVILRASGQIVDCFGDDTFGVRSTEQLSALARGGVQFEEVP